MTHSIPQLVLALDWGDVAIPLIIVIFWLIGAAAEIVKNVKKSGEPQDAEAKAKAEQLTEQRRRKLQEMAKEGTPKTFKELVATIKKQMEAPSTRGETVVLGPEIVGPKAKPKRERKVKPSPPVSSRMRPVAGPPGHEGDVVHRHVPDVVSVERVARKPKVRLASLSRRELQQAWMIREVLDAPSALRHETRRPW